MTGVKPVSPPGGNQEENNQHKTYLMTMNPIQVKKVLPIKMYGEVGVSRKEQEDLLNNILLGRLVLSLGLRHSNNIRYVKG